MAEPPGARTRPRVFYGWYIVGAHMALHFYFSVIFIYGMGAFFRPITVQLGWTRAQYSVAAGLQRIEGSIASPVVGLLVDRIGSRRIVFVGITLATIGMVLLSRMQSLFGFYSAYIVVALGMSGVVGIPFMAAAARWFNRRRGRAMGLMFSGATFSGVLIPVLVLSIESLGWRDTMLISAAGILVVGIPAVLIVRDRPEPYGYLPDGDAPVADDDQATGSAAAPPQQGIRVADALRMRSFWVLTLIFGLTSMGPSAMFLHQIPYFESIGFSATAAGTTVATFTLLSGLGRVGAGFLMDFVERRMVGQRVLAHDRVRALVRGRLRRHDPGAPYSHGGLLRHPGVRNHHGPDAVAGGGGGRGGPGANGVGLRHDRLVPAGHPDDHRRRVAGYPRDAAAPQVAGGRRLSEGAGDDWRLGSGRVTPASGGPIGRTR